MTPQELYAAIEEYKQRTHLPKWRIAIQLECSQTQIAAMGRGIITPPLQSRAEEWVRRQAQPRE